jgi:hypothetical protein
MKANRFTEEQIVKALREVETGGKKAVDQQRKLGVSDRIPFLDPFGAEIGIFGLLLGNRTQDIEKIGSRPSPSWNIIFERYQVGAQSVYSCILSINLKRDFVSRQFNVTACVEV